MAKKTYFLLTFGMLLLIINAKGLSSETGALEVAVFKEIDNQPLKNAKVSFMDTKTVETIIVETDEKGIARIDIIPSDRLMTNVSKDEYTPYENDILMTAEKGKVNHIDIYLGVAPKITGLVYDKTGKSIEGASVQLVPEGPPEMVTDANGKFELRLAPRPIQLFFAARHIKENLAGSIQFRSGIGGNEEYYSKDMNVEVEVSPGFTLTGKIVDPNRKAIPGVWVEAEIYTGRGDTPIAKVQADENGQYSINALPIGHRYYIKATRDGYGVALKSLGEISTYQDSINVDTQVLYEANQILAGQVVDANGHGVEDARIHCFGEGQPERKIRTDSDGKFIIRNICKGPLRISVTNGRLAANMGTESGVKDLRIVLESPPMIYTAIAPIVKEAPPRRLVGKSLHQLDEIDIPLNDNQLKQKSILLCFFDIEQRPSRNCILELDKRVQELKEKYIEIIAIHTSNIEREYLNKWLKENNIDFPIEIVKENEEQTRFHWGVKALPWLILTDREHIVTDEGFALAELDEHIK